MPIFLVDRYMPGITAEQWMTTERAAMAMSDRFRVAGKPVRYLRSTLVPEESHCMALFDAQSAKLVQEVNEAAQAPFTRVIEALDLTP